MPSPFPGMDPYLEDPALWPDVHSRLINVASEMLLAQLRPRYFVQIDERLYLADETDEGRELIVPDIRVRPVESVRQTQPAPSRSGTVVAPGIEIEVGWELEVREGRLQIIDRELQRVVTVVEVPSPANKVKGSAGKRTYDEKKQEVLSSQTSLVEIDLLRGGTRLYARRGPRTFDYLAQVWRWVGDRYRRWVWPMVLEQPLNTIPIPVRLGDEDAALDLQAILQTAYDRAGYDLRIDYSTDPVPPLQTNAADWARDLVARWKPTS